MAPATNLVRATTPELDDEHGPAWRPATAAGARFAGLKPADLDILEHGGRYLYPDALRRKNVKKGEVEEIPIRVRTPSSEDRAQARRDALRWVTKVWGDSLPSPLTIEAAISVAGPVYWEHFDNVCLLSRCIMKAEEPYTRYALPEMLDAWHPSASLYDVLERLDFWVQLEDPRVGELDEQGLWDVVQAIAEAGDASPLLAIAGSVRSSCIVSMARLLWSSRTPRS